MNGGEAGVDGEANGDGEPGVDGMNGTEADQSSERDAEMASPNNDSQGGCWVGFWGLDRDVLSLLPGLCVLTFLIFSPYCLVFPILNDEERNPKKTPKTKPKKNPKKEKKGLLLFSSDVSHS